jgi:hypothetical protein
VKFSRKTPSPKNLPPDLLALGGENGLALALLNVFQTDVDGACDWFAKVDEPSANEQKPKNLLNV